MDRRELQRHEHGLAGEAKFAVEIASEDTRICAGPARPRHPVELRLHPRPVQALPRALPAPRLSAGICPLAPVGEFSCQTNPRPCLFGVGPRASQGPFSYQLDQLITRLGRIMRSCRRARRWDAAPQSSPGRPRGRAIGPILDPSALLSRMLSSSYAATTSLLRPSHRQRCDASAAWQSQCNLEASSRQGFQWLSLPSLLDEVLDEVPFSAAGASEVPAAGRRGLLAISSAAATL
ncbi:hypothetical protein B0I35DRAFT_44866 [Stachybotrys elegans]|uniref:Uncharacterized protein n=1 Tax=Stachybotrys elegans TaxID=80388 RepID=A0A8K0T5Z8_9HYPO|nr:hypothetical protein B0I35DRAFT_44866 [Stachybotrys elegans]